MTRPAATRRRSRLPQVATAGELVGWAARRLARARLHYGHGTDNPLDEAGALVFHALGIGHEEAPRAYGWSVDAAGVARAANLVERRIRERLPSAYLTGRTWFAGHEIAVTPEVLVPRSPIAELCERRGFVAAAVVSLEDRWVRVPLREADVAKVAKGTCLHVRYDYAPRMRVVQIRDWSVIAPAGEAR